MRSPVPLLASFLLGQSLVLSQNIYTNGPWTFLVGNNDEVTVTSYTGIGPGLSVPSVLDIYPVTQVGSGEPLVQVLLPQGASRTNPITSIVIPDTVKTIAANAFGNSSFGNFPNFSLSGLALMNLTLGNGVTTIGDNAFANARIPELTIPDSVTNLSSTAFSGCDNLSAVFVGSGMTNYESLSSFLNLPSAPAITVSSNNPAFSVIDGVIFNASADKLLGYPKSRQGSYSIPENVTTVGPSAFRQCSSLNSVTFPGSLTTIDNYAFGDCGGLAEITIPDGVTTLAGTAFVGCFGLTNVSLGSGVTSYDALVSFIDPVPYATSSFSDPFFSQMFLIETLPPLPLLQAINVSSDNPAFSSIDGVVFDKDGKTLFAYPKGRQGAYNIPSGATAIGDGAFIACAGLTSVVLPEGMTVIGNKAFAGPRPRYIYNSAFAGFVFPIIEPPPTAGACTNLTNVTLPESLTTIGSHAFAGCTALAEVAIPDGVTNLSSSAFVGCAGLTNVTIGSGVTDHQSLSSFLNFVPDWRSLPALLPPPLPLTSLQAVHFSSNNPVFSSKDGVVFTKDGDALLSYPRGRQGAYIIPSGVTSVGVAAFLSCVGLTSIIVPEGVTTIGDGAFSGPPTPSLTSPFIHHSGCTSLTNVSLPQTLASIGSYAFAGCTGLTELTIPEGVTTIGDGAFSFCTSLVEISLPARFWNDTARLGLGENVRIGNASAGAVGSFISASRTQSEEAGRAQVTSNPAAFGLYTEQERNAMFTNGIETGIAAVVGNPAAYGLHTSDSIMDLRMNGIMVQKQGNSAVVTFQPQTTTDLSQPFTNNGTVITNEIPMPGNKGFLRIQAKP